VKKYVLPLAVCTSLMAANANSESLSKLPFTFSGDVGAYSDYRFRGISQTQESPALQADVTATHESGLKLGVWASNVDFNTPHDGSMEVDITAGYQKKLAEKVTAEAGAIYYWYPSADRDLNYDYVEAYTSVGYDFGVASVTASLNVSPDFFGGSGTAYYPHLALQIPLPNQFALDAGIGRQYIEKNAAYGVPDYTEWMLGAHYDFSDNTIALKYQDTDIGENHCSVGCGATAVVSFSRKF
jgi:uncharacterized protein (TIGR02001 family)